MCGSAHRSHPASKTRRCRFQCGNLYPTFIVAVPQNLSSNSGDFLDNESRDGLEAKARMVISDGQDAINAQNIVAGRYGPRILLFYSWRRKKTPAGSSGR